MSRRPPPPPRSRPGSAGPSRSARRPLPPLPRRSSPWRSRRNVGFAASALALVLLVAFLARGRPGDEVANLRSADGPGGIVVLGDSLAAGTGATPAEAWPTRLASSLGCAVANAGIPGNTTADGLARLDGILATRPRIVLVELGGNDFLRKVDRRETGANLDRILAAVARSGAIPVLLGIELGVFVDEYGDLYRRVAKKNGAFYVPDLLGGILGHPALMSDSIHPNAEGYRRIAERLDRELRALIARSGHPCG